MLGKVSLLHRGKNTRVAPQESRLGNALTQVAKTYVVRHS